MSTPVDAFLSMEKRAFFGELARGAKNQFSGTAAENLGGKMVGGGLLAAGGMLAGGVGAAATKIYEAVDKRRGFKEMMSLDPDLHGLHGEDPVRFNAVYSSLRAINPVFGKDPIISGSYMRHILSQDRQDAGKLLAGTVQLPRAGAQPGAPIRLESLVSPEDAALSRQMRLSFDQ